MAYPTYPQAYPQMFQNYPQSQSTNGINWVQGIEGAKAWQLQPNSNIILLDSENDGKFYIKTSDNVGMCNLRVFKYEEITNVPKQNSELDLSEYVKRSELESLIKSIIGGTQDEQTVSATNGNTKKPTINK